MAAAAVTFMTRKTEAPVKRDSSHIKYRVHVATDKDNHHRKAVPYNMLLHPVVEQSITLLAHPMSAILKAKSKNKCFNWLLFY